MYFFCRSVVIIENPTETHTQPATVTPESNPPSNGSTAGATTAAAATSSETTPAPVSDTVPKGLTVWREAVQRSNTSAQLAMCLYMLEASIAWDKSIMKAVREQTLASYNRANKRARIQISVGVFWFAY